MHVCLFAGRLNLECFFVNFCRPVEISITIVTAILRLLVLCQVYYTIPIVITGYNAGLRQVGELISRQ